MGAPSVLVLAPTFSLVGLMLWMRRHQLAAAVALTWALVPLLLAVWAPKTELCVAAGCVALIAALSPRLDYRLQLGLASAGTALVLSGVMMDLRLLL